VILVLHYNYSCSFHLLKWLFLIDNSFKLGCDITPSINCSLSTEIENIKTNQLIIFKKVTKRIISKNRLNFQFWCDYTFCTFQPGKGPSCAWSHGNWIYNYLCNQCLSLLMWRVRISIRARCTTLCDKVCQWLETGR
jgi:hypothetical protein